MELPFRRTGMRAYSGQSTVHVSGPVLLNYVEAAETVATAVASERDILLERYCSVGADPDANCVEAFVRGFGRRAYRRPLDSEESGRVVALYNRVLNDESDPVAAFAALLTRLLISPHFLYKLEPPDSSAGLLNGFGLASRLSFFLWQTAPDEALLDAAESGELTTSTGIVSHAQRMLADPRAEAALWSFHSQWLDLETVRFVNRSVAEYPEFTDDLKESLVAESRALVRHIAFEGRAPFSDLFSAGYTFADDRIAAVYGIEANGFDTVAPYPPSSGRAGVFGHGAFLASHRNDTEAIKVIHRGLVVQRNVLCTSFGAPPPGATAMAVSDRISQPACGGCHGLIDPAGFGFADFDSIGRYTAASSSNGEIVGTGTGLDGPFSSVAELGTRLGSSDPVRTCYARNLLRFALGRDDEAADEASIGEAADAFREESIRELILAFVQTEAFRTRTGSQVEGGCSAL